MTTEERFERIEHVTAGIAEERRKDREEFRSLWRDTQRHLNELTLNVAGLRDRMAELAEEAAARDRETDRRFRETDARIDKMISAMGGYIREHPPEPAA